MHWQPKIVGETSGTDHDFLLVAGGYLATDGTFVRAGPRFLFPVKAVKR